MRLLVSCAQGGSTVCRYNRLYPDPKTIIGHILRPVVAADPLSQPQIHSKLRLGGRLWKVHLQFNWPQKFRVCGQGDDHERAVHYAYLSACHMFTHLGLLTDGKTINYKETLFEIQKVFKNDAMNQIIEFRSKHEVLSKHSPAEWTTEIKINSPLVVNVSAKGVTQEDAEQTAAALMIMKLRGTVYTWKKKFEGCRVLCWCDNQQAVNFINDGLLVKPNKARSLLKMFKVLRMTCLKYNIDLRAQHIYRLDNIAADRLSKHDIETFIEMFPNAAIKSKKSKKMLFFLPLTDPASQTFDTTKTVEHSKEDSQIT
ncbi:hypothetical protein NP493_135g03049 [Ridgeia piscesae]|uniref:DRBM domain-containing protein n=1 Tax=Ridgeia piscesae TaxID=27915 RepID=A0AAD9P558_RIDPI|nr:hypothetical protein NP493_135g03049 [Ridgeia piscesae]